MQPYFMPYIGYWQLINAVDIFVILDDVNYIKRGYINSNSILINGKAHKFSISINKQSQNIKINETKLYFPDEEREKLVKMINMAYKKAPFYNDVFPVIRDCVLFEEEDLTFFIKNSIEQISKYLDIKTRIILSSDINKNSRLVGQDRIIDINKCLNSDIYINPIGGKSLYVESVFKNDGLELFFLKTKPFLYHQFNNEFVPNLSIIDILMFNSREQIKKILSNYDLEK